MAKSKKAPDISVTAVDARLRDLKRVRESLHLIPEPTYSFEIRDRVSIGRLEDVYVCGKCNDGKIYEIDYSSSTTKSGERIKTEHLRRFVSWMDIRKYVETPSKESFIENGDLRLSYMQTPMLSLFGKAYHFGVNFEAEYQRDYVWEMSDKVALIDAIFKNVDIGKFVFIEYDSQKWQETGFGDEVLDGKQRLRAILDFYEDRFTYNGKHFSELSPRDQDHFEAYPVAFAEASNLTKEQILRYFIMLNTSGKAMSKEHIDKVKMMLAEVVGE